MITRPVIRPHLHLQVVEPDRVFLFGEGRQFALEGKSYVAVTGRIDGQRTSNAIIEDLIRQGTVSATESAYALLTLERHRYIEEAPQTMPLDQAAFWSALDVPVAFAEHALTTRSVGLHSLVDGPLPALRDALGSVGIRIASSKAEADVLLVVTDDYLRPELSDVNLAALSSSQPWMLLQPNGLMPLVGPVFRPGTTACWACLAQRLEANRELEGFLSRIGGRATPFSARAGLPTTAGQAIDLSVTEIAKALLDSPWQSLTDRIVTIDALGAAIREHTLVRRPQCAACGDPLAHAVARPMAMPLEPVRKQFVDDGGHRATSPEESLRRYRHHISPITGVVKNLTRITATDDALQHVYISGQNLATRYDSFQSLRRNIRGSSCGKGVTDAQAQVSAICEAVERYSGVFRGEEYRIRSTRTALAGAALDPATCMLYSERQYDERATWNGKGRRLDHIPLRFDDELEMDWTPLWSLTRREVRYLPTSYLFYSHPTPPDEFVCPPDSNGCAAGNTREEAILQGFMELVERDSVAIWWYNRLSRPGLDLDAIDLPYLQQLRAAHRLQQREIWVLDVTADWGIPAFVALSRRTDSPIEDITFAPAAHFDPRIALLRALTELNQMMPGVAQRDQDGRTVYAYDDPEAQAWWQSATVGNQPWLLPASDLPLTRLDDFPRRWADDLRTDIETCQRIVEGAGLEMLVLDQTRPDIGIPVTKVVVPGMRHFWARYAPGRLYDVPVTMGWRETALTEDQLNPVTIFI